MRKRRTRQHIIEDLGFNHIERHVLYAGYTLQRYTHNDYGYDALLNTFNEEGEAESQIMYIQLKSTDKIKISSNKKTFLFDVSRQDLELWEQSNIPVMLILYDAQKEQSYYVYLKEYFQKDGFDLNKIRKFVRIYIPTDHIWNSETVIKLRHITNNF